MGGLQTGSLGTTEEKKHDTADQAEAFAKAQVEAQRGGGWADGELDGAVYCTHCLVAMQLRRRVLLRLQSCSLVAQTQPARKTPKPSTIYLAGTRSSHCSAVRNDRARVFDSFTSTKAAAPAPETVASGSKLTAEEQEKLDVAAKNSFSNFKMPSFSANPDTG